LTLVTLSQVSIKVVLNNRSDKYGSMEP